MAEIGGVSPHFNRQSGFRYQVVRIWPDDGRADKPIIFWIAITLRLIIGANYVHIAGGGAKGQFRVIGAGGRDRFVLQAMGPFRPIAFNYIFDCLPLLLRLTRVDVAGGVGHAVVSFDVVFSVLCHDQVRY